MKKYEDGLWGGVSAIQILSGDVSRQDWKRYVDSLGLVEKYPGINGLGVIHNVPEKKLENYLKVQRKDLPSYDIYPKHTKNEFLPITYIEPVKTNAKAVGLDMAHETNRYTAAIKARDSGKAQITGPITLVQDSGKNTWFFILCALL